MYNIEIVFNHRTDEAKQNPNLDEKRVKGFVVSSYECETGHLLLISKNGKEIAGYEPGEIEKVYINGKLTIQTGPEKWEMNPVQSWLNQSDYSLANFEGEPNE